MTQPFRRGFAVLVCAAVALLTGCNSVFGIREGTPRLMCADELMIDDLEDGDAAICKTNERNGSWFVVADGTSTDLNSSEPFEPTSIEGGARGASRYAARFEGSGFTGWGALMGLELNVEGLALASVNASTTTGIRFWMKSNVPVSVGFPIPETSDLRFGGECFANPNCSRHFAFRLTAPSPDWAEYEIPFSALSQGGSARWDPRFLQGVQFGVAPGAPFDVWVDDLRFFYKCSSPLCVPTCTDPDFPTPCPANGRHPASCTPRGTDCAIALRLRAGAGIRC